jgi:hypothetical protein
MNLLRRNPKSRANSRKPVRALLSRRPLSLRRAARQSNRMHARRTGFRGL